MIKYYKRYMEDEEFKEIRISKKEAERIRNDSEYRKRITINLDCDNDKSVITLC